VSNVVNDIVTVYRYNAQNKLARIEGQGFSYDFLYDSRNRRDGVDTLDGAAAIGLAVHGQPLPNPVALMELQ